MAIQHSLATYRGTPSFLLHAIALHYIVMLQYVVTLILRRL